MQYCGSLRLHPTHMFNTVIYVCVWHYVVIVQCDFDTMRHCLFESMDNVCLTRYSVWLFESMYNVCLTLYNMCVFESMYNVCLALYNMCVFEYMYNVCLILYNMSVLEFIYSLRFKLYSMLVFESMHSVCVWHSTVCGVWIYVQGVFNTTYYDSVLSCFMPPILIYLTQTLLGEC